MTQGPPSLQQQPGTWDAVAPTYAADAWQWGDYAGEALRTLALAAGDRILDVGAGPGTFALVAARHAAHVVGIDFSPGMIEELAARAKRDGLTNVEAKVMDAQELSFEDGSFDAAFSLFAFFFFPDRGRAFREMHRVLRPGGRALIATWSPIERRPIMKLAFEALAESVPQAPLPTKGDLQDPAECVREMTAAGFHDVSAHLFEASVRIESAEHYFELISRSAAPFAVMRKKVGEQAFEGIRTAVVAALRKRLPAGPTDLSAEAIFTVGTR